MDTIAALSSGVPPAAIAIVRVSGSDACAAVVALVGSLPPPRQASLRGVRDASGALLDRVLVLLFPGPASATGEDLVELHCHGGRATVEAVVDALLARPGVRRAEPGEFTRRALINGRIDLAQAEGLADLLQAETEAQRRAALDASEGRVSRAVCGWLDRIASMSALVEAALDFAEEDDVAGEASLIARAKTAAAALRQDMLAVLEAPPVERVRDGVRVVLAGPPNAGKSTLLNLLTQSDSAIVSPIAGTTRDRVEVPVRRGGIAYRLTDTAGLTETTDPVEQVGVERAADAVQAADLLLWLGDDPPPRGEAIWVHARADLPGRERLPIGRDIAIRADRHENIDQLWTLIDGRCEALLPRAHHLPMMQRQRDACAAALSHLVIDDDPLIAGEGLRLAGRALARVLGVDATEMMLDSLFRRFCLGK